MNPIKRLPAPPASPSAQRKPGRRFGLNVGFNIGFYITLSILLLVTGMGWGQTNGWHYLTGGLLLGVKNIGNNIFIVGRQGLILCSTDKGDTWDIRESGTDRDLYGLSFPDNLHGWAVGETFAAGSILRTTDGGISWSTQQNVLGTWFWGVCFVDTLHGWVCGPIDTILKTTDGGATWSKIRFYKQNHGTGIIFIDTLKGWASTETDGVLKTTDGGQTWIAKPYPGIWLYGIDMLDSLRGWVAGTRIIKTINGWDSSTTQFTPPGCQYSISIGDTLTVWTAGGMGSSARPATIIRTTDGGMTWVVDTTLTHDHIFHGVDGHLQTNNVTVVGEGGAIIRSTNAGATWRVTRNVDIGSTSLLNVTFWEVNQGWAVGTYGVITHTVNGGTVWRRQTSGVSSFLYGVSFADSQYGKICTDGGGVLGTRNGGNTWAGESTGAASPLWNIDYPDTAFAVAVGGYYGPLNSGIRDQGLGVREKGEIASSSRFPSGTPRNDTLRSDTLPLKETSLDCCKRQGRQEGTNPTTAYRTITRTTNGGATWIAQNTNENPLYGVKFITRGHGWACGDGGTVLHTTDLGATWQTQTTGVTNGLYWITFQDTLHGWTCGSGGRALWTTDGGNTWNIGASGVTQYLNSIAFTDTLTGFAVSDNGLIIKSTDGGRNWLPDTSKCYANFPAVFALDSTHVWTVGSFGMVLGWGEAGNTGIEQGSTGAGGQGRKDIALGQSYPNPTRGIASFEYELAKTEKVRVRVYNIAGQAVRTLVEGLEPAGRHVVVWDGKDAYGRKAGSGTYFYCFEAGGRKAVRKLIVIR